MELTCVSSYYEVKNKHTHNKYKEWFKNTLSINCPYVFFTTKDNIEFINSFRKDLPTYFIECNIEDFNTYKYKDKMITHRLHCPSVELNLIWNEKLFMLQKAAKLNPFNSQWFKWIDAGICIYRDIKPPTTPFPNIAKLNELPKDKFIFSSSQTNCNKMYIHPKNYYHYISGTYLLHINIIDEFIEKYISYLNKIDFSTNIWTDQVILTHIYNDYDDLFYELCHGYGEITKYLS
jgi:hypothetical protein